MGVTRSLACHANTKAAILRTVRIKKAGFGRECNVNSFAKNPIFRNWNRSAPPFMTDTLLGRLPHVQVDGDTASLLWFS